MGWVNKLRWVSYIGHQGPTPLESSAHEAPMDDRSYNRLLYAVLGSLRGNCLGETAVLNVPFDSERRTNEYEERFYAEEKGYADNTLPANLRSTV